MKKQLLVLSALLLTGATLASCDNSSASTTVEEVKYSVSLEAEQGSSITLSDSKGAFEPGVRVDFQVEMTSDLKEFFGVLLDDEVLYVDNEGKGHFTMPNHDVTLKTVLATVGDGSLRNVSTLADDFVAPTTMDEVKKVFAASALVQGKYASGEIVENTFSNFSWPEAHLVSAGSRSGGVMTYGSVRTGVGSDSTTPYFYQAGMEGDKYFYTITSSGTDSLTSSTQQYKVEPKIYNVFDEVKDKSKEKTKEEAERLSSTQDFISMISDDILGAYSIWATSEDSISVVSEISEDKKSYSVVIDSVYSGYSSTAVSTFSALIDGDGFVDMVGFETESYKTSDWDKENKAPVEGAKPDTTGEFSYIAVRDYKEDFNLSYDINDFVMHDYDIKWKQKTGSSYSAVNVVDNKVDGNATVSFQISSYDVNFNTIKPRIVAITDGFGTINSAGTSFEVTKLGKFKVTFDNGLGELKEVELEAVKPAAQKIEFSLASNASIFAGHENEITVKVTPSLADQDVTLAVDDTKSGVETLIVDQGNGVFTLKPAEAGNVYLKAATKDGSKTATLALKAIEKPTMESAKAVLTSKSLKLYANYEYYWINFNEDGTGVMYVGSTYDGFVSYAFTYTIDADLNFTFTFPSHEGKDTWYAIKSITYGSETSVSGTIEGAYYGAAKEFSGNFTVDSRKAESYFE